MIHGHEFILTNKTLQQGPIDVLDSSETCVKSGKKVVEVLVTVTWVVMRSERLFSDRVPISSNFTYERNSSPKN